MRNKSPHSQSGPGELARLRAELDQAKQRLQDFGVSLDPRFDPHAFRMAFLRYTLIFVPLLVLLGVAGNAYLLRHLPELSETRLLDLPLLAISNQPTPWYTGLAPFAWISLGGLAFGVFAFGGLSVGLVAIGGGAVGLIAVGGGAVGLIAIGGGSLGMVALGGGAYGHYVLAGDGAGRHVLSYRRQDRRAARFFCRIFPRLQNAFPQGIDALDDPAEGR